MITKESWKRLSDSIKDVAGNIQEKSWSSYNHYSIEECVKSGRVTTTVEMLVSLESEIRVLKRRLIQSLPTDEQINFHDKAAQQDPSDNG